MQWETATPVGFPVCTRTPAILHPGMQSCIPYLQFQRASTSTESTPLLGGGNHGKATVQYWYYMLVCSGTSQPSGFPDFQ